MKSTLVYKIMMPLVLIGGLFLGYKYHSPKQELAKAVPQTSKQDVLDTYVYDMIRSGQLPDPGIAPIDEISQSYVNILAKNGLVIDKDAINIGALNSVIKQSAKDKGELLQCN